MREHVSRQKKTTTGFSIPSLKHPIRGFGLESSAISRQAVPEIQPLHKPLTHDISRIPLRTQAKLSISQPGDIYEQEADSVAQQVMQRMAQPVNRQSIQREALPEEEEELQMKSLDNSTLQRQQAPEDEEELQMKPMVQRQAGMAAAPDLEATINQARGGGQAIADNIRQPMEQAFGADFSGVKVHTDGQSDQLNQSIQARAFTTGQDVFFRQGEYNPGSRGGQKLLAHELTHVVQQNGAVQLEQLQRADEDRGTTDENRGTEEATEETQVTLPPYFYHATSKANARAIAQNGLQPRSVGGQQGTYLCMSGVRNGATTKERAASDIIFRVKSSNLNAQSWTKQGAGTEEWRSTAGVPGNLLEYRRYLGNDQQKAWRPTSDTSHLPR
ncbi:MAG: DUF4157 domain-containing protein [Nostoc sp. NOS(2021)]|uniref:eCIS core domain-containing protein n=1 Tax=Nostoc sp. NOS(2021) TaxID=2815407 RepID=UPI0025EC46FF|nr:DUF4157 domain-containing protein [Nostoc sp. NOS(2021)]MBN3895955.1 DUF4157 domain-containing protein [Nostoc sp. NOS(2021)]